MNDNQSTINLASAQFLIGAAHSDQFPQDDVMEVAFAGRSNVGKSSALNALTGQKKLARTSKQPGRTQQINFFQVAERARLVDLPGYGFAQVPLKVKKEWPKTIHYYLANRSNLAVLVLLMDIRHPFTDLDQQMVDWAYESGLPTQILLTKADKFKRGKMMANLHEVEKQLKARFSDAESLFAVEPFSSLSGLGVTKMRNQIIEWFNSEHA